MGSNGLIIGRDEVRGEVQIHTPHAMQGYLNNPSATAEAFTSDGWVRSGDVGYVKEGNWYIIDRTKDLIKVRGWQVSPAEVEAALLEHSDILDAGVIGVPAKDGCGEAPLAFVVRKEKSHLKEDGVKEFLSGRLARYKNVEEVEFVESIPRNPTGKILRRMLRNSRESNELTPQQEAAEAYATALQRLGAYEQSRSLYNGEVVNGTSKSEASIMVTTAANDDSTFRAGSRKRKYCPSCVVSSWRKLRFPKRDA
jgi:long-subunit acyl-CoA synthetase (AMP-forming)